MAETAIISVLTKFGELASREAAVLLQVGDDILLLRDRLEWLQAFVRDADRKRRLGGDDLTRVWVRQTRDAAFEAEDTLEHFFHKVDLENKGYRGWKDWHRYFTLCITQITVRHGLSARIKKFKDRLDLISENRKEFKIEHIPSGTWTSSFTEFAPWYNFKRKNIVKYLVGFEGYLKELEMRLRNGEYFPFRQFVSILGESGTGKYTLMKEIYSQVNDHFKVLIWYYMPPNSSTEDLLKEIYIRALENMDPEEQAKYSDSQQEKDTDFARKLHRLLDKKRYLLILSGVSSKTILNCLGACLPDNNIGSRIVLMEPGNEDIAKHAETINAAAWPVKMFLSNIIQLSRLNKEESGHLFRLRVFGDAESKNQRNMRDDSNDKKKKKIKFLNEEKSYDQDVFDITGGNPLAIVVLAGLLRSKEKPVEWDIVLQQLKPAAEAQGSQDNQITVVQSSREHPVDWEKLLQQRPLERQAMLSNKMCIERIFSTSFDDLPHDLKSCFLYFAAFPKNLCHPADRIVRMWTAEGFIKPRKDKTMEEVGRDYLEELASRCLIEVEETNKQDEIELVRVHNRLLAFLQSEAREASFVEVHDTNDVVAPASVRRLSIQHDCGSDATTNNKFPKLRSFICYVEEVAQISESVGRKEMNNSGHNHKFPNCGSKLGCTMMPACLRDRGGRSTNDNVKSNLDLKFLGGSKFLRVISIQGVNIAQLPEDICDMIHLRYLRVACRNLKKLPSSIGRLLNLQTLDIRKTKIEWVHPKFWKIKTLRHVLAEDLMLPNSVIKAQELQTLQGVRPSKENWVVGRCPLDLLKKLGSLELHGFVASQHSQALEIALEKMHFLEHLELTGDEIPSCVFTTPSLRCLHTLFLHGNVQRNDIPAEIRMLRPNLDIFEANDSNKVPEEFKADLAGNGMLRLNSLVSEASHGDKASEEYELEDITELRDNGMLKPNPVVPDASGSNKAPEFKAESDDSGMLRLNSLVTEARHGDKASEEYELEEITELGDNGMLRANPVVPEENGSGKASEFKAELEDSGMLRLNSLVTEASHSDKASEEYELEEITELGGNGMLGPNLIVPEASDIDKVFVESKLEDITELEDNGMLRPNLAVSEASIRDKVPEESELEGFMNAIEFFPGRRRSRMVGDLFRRNRQEKRK